MNYEPGESVKQDRSMSPLVLAYLYWWQAAAWEIYIVAVDSLFMVALADIVAECHK